MSYGPPPAAWRVELALRSAAIAGWLSLVTLLVAAVSFALLCLPATRTAFGAATRPIQD